MNLTVGQELNINFLRDEMSHVIGSLGYAEGVNDDVVFEAHEHTQLLVSDQLKAAKFALREARQLLTNLIEGQSYISRFRACEECGLIEGCHVTDCSLDPDYIENENAGTMHVQRVNDPVVIQDDGSGNQVLASGRVLR